MTETHIAVQRIDKFLSMPEPPPPVHMRAKPVAAAAKDAKVQLQRQSTETGVVLCDYPDGYVELGGADYDWSTNVEEMAAQVRGYPSPIVWQLAPCCSLR